MQSITGIPVFGKRVLVRADLDVPLSPVSSIRDDSRLQASLPTVQYLLDNGATVIVAGHIGRPEGESYELRSKNHELSLELVAKWFAQQFKVQNSKCKVDEFDGWKLNDHLFVLENLRFYPGEETNDSELAKRLAGIADIYVNDAFGDSHRAHASIVGIAGLLPHYAGLRLEEEVQVLSKVLQNPQKPLVVIIGGAKIETKLPLIEKMHRFADFVLVGGKLAQETTTLLKVQHEKVEGNKGTLLVAELIEDGTDITQASVSSFLKIISLAKTVVWNGPLGEIPLGSPWGKHNSEFIIHNSTERIAQGIIDSEAYCVVGGGDTVEFLNEKGLLDKFSFVSTGGGAMLAFLSGEKLPGLEVLSN